MVAMFELFNPAACGAPAYGSVGVTGIIQFAFI